MTSHQSPIPTLRLTPNSGPYTSLQRTLHRNLQLVRRQLNEPVLLALTAIIAVAFASVPEHGRYVSVSIPFLVLLASSRRESLFEAALPISARALVFSRMFAAWGLAVAPLLVWALAVQLRGVRAVTPSMILAGVAMATVQVAALCIFRASEFSTTASMPTSNRNQVVMFTFVLYLPLLPGKVTATLFIVAVLVLVRAWVSFPPSLHPPTTRADAEQPPTGMRPGSALVASARTADTRPRVKPLAAAAQQNGTVVEPFTLRVWWTLLNAGAPAGFWPMQVLMFVLVGGSAVLGAWGNSLSVLLASYPSLNPILSR